METSDNNATSSPASAPASAPDLSRRRSGRVVRAPQKFSPEPQNDHSSSSKRKRGLDRDEEDAENESPVEEEEEELSDPEEEDEAEEEQTSRPKSSKSKQKSRSKKPAAKRTKVNGSAPADIVSASNAPAVRLPNRPKKTVRVTIAHPDGEGLYGEKLQSYDSAFACWYANVLLVDIFGSGDSSEDVAHQWFQRYRQDDAKALTDVINCVLLAAGCDQQLTEDDIRDPDNSTNRLSELEEAYQQVRDYPL